MTDQGKFLPSATAISYSGDQVKVTWEMSGKEYLSMDLQRDAGGGFGIRQ